MPPLRRFGCCTRAERRGTYCPQLNGVDFTPATLPLTLVESWRLGNTPYRPVSVSGRYDDH